ncbi:MAG: hypothetical protein ACTJHV_01645, partial [Cellulosimicrobium funkei]
MTRPGCRPGPPVVLAARASPRAPGAGRAVTHGLWTRLPGRAARAEGDAVPDLANTTITIPSDLQPAHGRVGS